MRLVDEHRARLGSGFSLTRASHPRVRLDALATEARALLAQFG